MNALQSTNINIKQYDIFFVSCLNSQHNSFSLLSYIRAGLAPHSGKKFKVPDF